MTIRILTAAAAFAVVSVAAQFSVAAHAGSLANGTWTPNCPAADPNAPEISSKSPDAYNKSAKAFQTWQANYKAYVECVSGEAKSDQGVIVQTINDDVKKFNDESTAGIAANNAAIDALKKKKN
jgi:hypothetical protein